MKSRSQKQDEAAWRIMAKTCRKKGWKCIGGWNFLSPSGTAHDLSAMNPEKLDYIENSNLSVVE